MLKRLVGRGMRTPKGKTHGVDEVVVEPDTPGARAPRPRLAATPPLVLVLQGRSSGASVGPGGPNGNRASTWTAILQTDGSSGSRRSSSVADTDASSPDPFDAAADATRAAKENPYLPASCWLLPPSPRATPCLDVSRAAWNNKGAAKVVASRTRTARTWRHAHASAHPRHTRVRSCQKLPAIRLAD